MSVHPVNDIRDSDEEADDFILPTLPENHVKIEGYENLGVLPCPGKHSNPFFRITLNLNNF